MIMTLFNDRTDAGQQLAKALGQYADTENVVVLALPRGGLPVAYEVAKALQAPLVFRVIKNWQWVLLHQGISRSSIRISLLGYTYPNRTLMRLMNRKA